ncbi:hypothetical protein B0H14DRAFT_2557107 [Mycena olivaceomarginata]|nr:hypothetical protein B0H14DRAFT_2557107 [Mycena olivaceomarginata]
MAIISIGMLTGELGPEQIVSGGTDTCTSRNTVVWGLDAKELPGTPERVPNIAGYRHRIITCICAASRTSFPWDCVTAGHYVIGGGLPSPISSASPIVDGIKNGTRFPKKEMGESHSHSSSIDSFKYGTKTQSISAILFTQRGQSRCYQLDDARDNVLASIAS